MSSRPLSIAIFSDSALPILNGVSVSIDSLIKGLRAQNHSVHLFTSNYPGYVEQDPNTHRFFSAFTPLASEYPLALGPFYPVLSEFRRHRFDIIHTHTPFTVGFVGLRWAESHEIPIVSTYHTHYDKYTHYIPILPKRYARYKIAKHTNWYYGNVDRVITPSEHSRRWLERHSVHTPISIVPTAVTPPMHFDREACRNRFGALPHQKVLLYVGRIAQEKNIGQLIRAAAVAFAEDPRLVLWLVGDGPAREDYRRLSSDLGLGDRIRFFGFAPREEVGAYYAASDVFAFPSMTETQGLVVVEAMSYGLPAVVVKGGGASDPIQHGRNGLSVSNDSEEIARACLHILSRPELAQTLSQGAMLTAKNYSMENMVKKVVSVYEDVLGQSYASKALVV